MTDTQWPRFIVFHREKVGKPHTYAGSVHAPDPELALMNARDVFVRRPACVSLWVVPASAIYARTAEELTQQLSLRTNIADRSQPAEIFSVFQKSAHKGTFVQIGEVTAPTPEMALIAAFDSIADRSALAWWVFPSHRITRSSPEDIEVLFHSATTKDYRDQAFFHTVATLQKIKTQDTIDEV